MILASYPVIFFTYLGPTYLVLFVCCWQRLRRWWVLKCSAASCITWTTTWKPSNGSAAISATASRSGSPVSRSYCWRSPEWRSCWCQGNARERRRSVSARPRRTNPFNLDAEYHTLLRVTAASDVALYRRTRARSRRRLHKHGLHTDRLDCVNALSTTEQTMIIQYNEYYS